VTGCAFEVLDFVLDKCVPVNSHLFVALYACKFRVSSGQREACLLVIEFRWLPVVESVAALAVGKLSRRCHDRELSEMYVPVAGLAVRTERFEYRYLDSLRVLL